MGDIDNPNIQFLGELSGLRSDLRQGIRRAVYPRKIRETLYVVNKNIVSTVDSCSQGTVLDNLKRVISHTHFEDDASLTLCCIQDSLLKSFVLNGVLLLVFLRADVTAQFVGGHRTEGRTLLLFHMDHRYFDVVSLEHRPFEVPYDFRLTGTRRCLDKGDTTTN